MLKLGDELGGRSVVGVSDDDAQSPLRKPLRDESTMSDGLSGRS
jgi:hypothetical protein